MYIGLSKDKIKQLEFEVISEDVRLKIARLFREVTKHNDNSDIEIILKNRIINIARQVEGLPLYRLETDDEYYYPAEKAWHFAELELITRRPETSKFVEILCDLLQENLIPIRELNRIFTDDNSKIFFEEGDDGITVEIENVDNIPDEDISSEHPNIRKLINRIDVLFNSEDWSGVLHASATIFETLAKDVIKNPNIENKTLGSFFESYRNHSNLPEPIIEMIKAIYNKRNTEPLAGHGQTTQPTIGREEAIVLVEMTKSFVRMERKFAEINIISI